MRLEVGDERGCHPGPFDRLRVKLRPGSRFLCTAWMFRLWIPASAGMTKGAGRTMRAGCHPDLLRHLPAGRQAGPAEQRRDLKPADRKQIPRLRGVPLHSE